MELILWRHAEAAPSEPDEQRALTRKGSKQASKMADWLNHNLPESCRILVSPTTRTQQTAGMLGRKFKIHADLAPDKSPEHLLELVNWPNNRNPVLVIGHQPTLGRVAAQLISDQAQEWAIPEASVWWIAQRTDGNNITNYLRAAMSPELIVK